jgi:hypothetical protein
MFAIRDPRPPCRAPEQELDLVLPSAHPLPRVLIPPYVRSRTRNPLFDCQSYVNCLLRCHGSSNFHKCDSGCRVRHRSGTSTIIILCTSTSTSPITITNTRSTSSNTPSPLPCRPRLSPRVVWPAPAHEPDHGPGWRRTRGVTADVANPGLGSLGPI